MQCFAISLSLYSYDPLGASRLVQLNAFVTWYLSAELSVLCLVRLNQDV